MLKNEKSIEEAVGFLVESINSSGHNPKPVILHSLRVAMFLYNLGYNEEIIIGGLLHDVIEDSKTTKSQIEKKFGKDTSELVQSLSFDLNITDRKARFLDELSRIKKFGKKALIIKAADIIDNSNYYYLASDKNLYLWLLDKMALFIKNSKEELSNEPILKYLIKQQRIVQAKV